MVHFAERKFSLYTIYYKVVIQRVIRVTYQKANFLQTRQQPQQIGLTGDRN